MATLDPRNAAKAEELCRRPAFGGLRDVRFVHPHAANAPGAFKR